MGAATKVVIIGGTVGEPVLTLCATLTASPGLVIAVWCPDLTVEALQEVSRYPVETTTAHTPLAANRVFLIPSDLGVTVERERFVATGRDRGPFDHLLRTAADAFGADAIGVVLAGTGADGSIGMKRLKEAGGLTVAQQVVGDGSALPASSIETGFVDFVLPLHEIAAHIQTPVDVKWPPAESQAATDTLRDILALVRVRSGHDFSAYKRATLYRRIARRMQVCECATLEAYHRYLREHPHELPHLLRDFLISVTNFFRDAEAFTALEQDIVPRLFANKGSNDQVRVWVTGCATGEEAYSIGMLLLEYASTLRAPPALQIFATDIDEAALAEARRGCYSDAIVADLTPERLVRFFTRESGQYRVTKELRELLLFSPHNVLRDPPFSRLDMVSCRNLLIYLDRDAQTRVLSLFQFGLRAQGVLFLGSSESAENTSTFAPLDVKNRLFLRQGTMVATSTPTLQAQRWNLPVLPNMPVVRERTTPIGEIHHRLVEYYAPPSMLLNSDLDVVHLSEHAGRYLQMAGGEPTRQALRLIHPELRLELRAAIYAARQSNAERRIVHFSDAAGSRHVEIRVRSVDMPDLGHGGVLVTFDDVPATMEEAKVIDDAGTIEPVMRQLEEELLRTRDQLRTTVEQYETSLEELKASNEELQAINEELRSATEELETSKEELQSVNEELTTLNQELKIKVDEISQANSDLQNLMMSTEIGVIFLDRSLNIKRFTPRVQDVFNIIPSDIGRPLTHLTHRLASDELTETAQSVLQSLRTIEKEVPTRNGSSYLVRWLPYRSIDDRIDGVVVTLIDVSDLREAVDARQKSESALRVVEERLRSAVRNAPIAVFAFDDAFALTWAFLVGREVDVGTLDLLTIFSADHLALLQTAVRAVAASREGRRIELAMRIGNGQRTFDFSVEPTAEGMTVVGFDITANKLAEIALRDADRRKDEFLATLSHELRNPLAPLKVALDTARMVGDDPVQRKESIEVMTRQVNILSLMVDELLDLSRITQGKVLLDRQRHELGDILESAVVQAKPALSDGDHKLSVTMPDQPVEVIGDERRLVQVFANLLGNAAKYTPAGGAITLEMLEPQHRRVAVRIVDNGIGIPPENVAKIFDIFVQSRDAEGRARGGLGIGLNVVRRLVELHDGTVSAKSDGTGKGSAFTVELPIAAD